MSMATQSPAPHAADNHDLIRVHGARVNNLKDVSTASHCLSSTISPSRSYSRPAHDPHEHPPPASGACGRTGTGSRAARSGSSGPIAQARVPWLAIRNSRPGEPSKLDRGPPDTSLRFLSVNGMAAILRFRLHCMTGSAVALRPFSAWARRGSNQRPLACEVRAAAAYCAASRTSRKSTTSPMLDASACCGLLPSVASTRASMRARKRGCASSECVCKAHMRPGWPVPAAGALSRGFESLPLR